MKISMLYEDKKVEKEDFFTHIKEYKIYHNNDYIGKTNELKTIRHIFSMYKDNINFKSHLCAVGNKNIIEYLRSNGIEFGTFDAIAACQTNNIQVVKMLLKDFTERNLTGILKYCCSFKNFSVELLKLFISSKIKIDEYIITQFLKCKNFEVLKFLGYSMNLIFGNICHLDVKQTQCILLINNDIVIYIYWCGKCNKQLVELYRFKKEEEK